MPVTDDAQYLDETDVARIKPLGDRVLVIEEEAESVRNSGLIIPEWVAEKPYRGEVIAVGPGRYDAGVRVEMDVKVGDTVLYAKYGGTEILVLGKDYRLLSERDLLAVLPAQ